MKGVTAWQFIKRCLYSCKTHTQLNVCKKMIDIATDNLYITYGSAYRTNLYDIYYERWEELNDIEDKELLEKNECQR